MIALTLNPSSATRCAYIACSEWRDGAVIHQTTELLELDDAGRVALAWAIETRRTRGEERPS